VGRNGKDPCGGRGLGVDVPPNNYPQLPLLLSQLRPYTSATSMSPVTEIWICQKMKTHLFMLQEGYEGNNAEMENVSESLLG
jgi:hypothetical protein